MNSACVQCQDCITDPRQYIMSSKNRACGHKLNCINPITGLEFLSYVYYKSQH